MFTAAKGTQLLTDMVSRGHRQGPDMSDSSQPHRGSCIVALRPYQLEGLTRPGPVCVEADLLQCVLKTTLAANAPQEDVNYFRQHGFAHAAHSFCRAVQQHDWCQQHCAEISVLGIVLSYMNMMVSQLQNLSHQVLDHRSSVHKQNAQSAKNIRSKMTTVAPNTACRSSSCSLVR